MSNYDVDVPLEERKQHGEPFYSVLERAISRRTVLRGIGVAGAVLFVRPGFGDSQSSGLTNSSDPGERLRFATVPFGNNSDVVVPPNYEVDVLLRWGDPLIPQAPAFDLWNQTGQSQAQQFGFNCDLVLWYPLPEAVSRWVEVHGTLEGFARRMLELILLNSPKNPRRALLAVNHEYTTPSDMFPDYDPANPTRNQVEVEIEAHGISIIELVRGPRGKWRFNRRSPFNRRITGSTPIEIAGPLRGHPLMQTRSDPSGTVVLGTLNNCAGGKTPWGTVLSCEENFDQYFAHFGRLALEERRLSERIPAARGETERKWERFVPRFDLTTDPKEYHRFGYVVEIDPYDPNFVPKKRTALGRFKHEAATCVLAKSGQVVVYSGDDARFEYVYKFISRRRFNPFNRRANFDLLDEGTLYVARFDVGEAAGDEMGTGVWLPLEWAPGNLLDRAGFRSQAEVLINTRGAADVLGATPMDRPEDIEASPKTGRVYVVLTNNDRRRTPNEANPRGPNPHGHILEIVEDGDDAGALTFRWRVFIKCGNPSVPADNARFGDIADPVGAGVSPISDPDNIVFDDDGNLWIATDGQFFSGTEGFGQNDGVFAVPVEGKNRGLLRQFLSGVPGCEICGPEFSGDNRTFFCAVQHPHEGEVFSRRWPFWPSDEREVSKPSVIAVYEKSGRKIGN
ncbi:MAG: PhoX family phosphatase [Methylohalobius sp.]|nr:PhoX family phosphatase [Methylohalobius sp.]